MISSFLRSSTRVESGPVLVVNASSEEELGINDELGMLMTCIGHEMGSKERYVLVSVVKRVGGLYGR